MCTDFQDLSTNAISWFWDFGDATTSTVQFPSHSYNAPGSYTVVLTATFPNNTTGTASGILTAWPNPIGAFTTSVSGSTVTFTDQSVGATGWFWDFGDSTSSTQQNPVHTYAAAGNKTVILLVTSSYGCTDSTSMNVTPTSIMDQALSIGWIVFPNPSEYGLITIHLESQLMGNEIVRVENLLGEIVLEENISNDATLDLASQPAGIYTIRVGSGAPQKLVIQK